MQRGNNHNNINNRQHVLSRQLCELFASHVNGEWEAIAAASISPPMKVVNGHNSSGENKLQESESETGNDEAIRYTSSLAEDSAAWRMVDTLIQAGIDTFFGICGGPSAPIFEAIRLHPDARFYQSRHETNAAFACSTYYRATGKAAVLAVSGGPGITNCVDGVASASAEEDAMIVLAGDVSWQSTGKILAQDSGPNGFDAEGTLRAFTRRQIRVLTANSVVGSTVAAMQSAENPERPGPALLVVPLHVATERVTSDHLVDVVRGLPPAISDVLYSSRHLPPSPNVQKVATELLFARRPLIIFGMKCRPYQANVEELIESSQVPFVVTTYAKGLLKDDQPWSLHNCGLGRKRFVEHYAEQGPIDVVVAIGTDLDDCAIASLDLSSADTKLYHVHNDAAVFGRNFPTTALAFASDSGSFCRDLKVAIEDKRRGRDDFTQEERSRMIDSGRQTLNAYRTAMAGMPYPFDISKDEQLEPIKSCRALTDLQAAMPACTRYIADVGDHTFVACSFLEVKRPNTFFVSLKLGSMGSGIGGAIGLAVANSESYVVAIVGDGAMQMYGMEVLVAVKYKLPIIYAIINDGRYNIVHHGMKSCFGQADPYDCPPVDFSQWAQSMGATACSISKGGQITNDLVGRLIDKANGGPIILDIAVDPNFHMSVDRVKCLTKMFAGGGNNDAPS